MRVFTVSTCGPNLCGRVALFAGVEDAKLFSTFKNLKNMYSHTAERDEDGISLAWKMGDGVYSWKEENLDLDSNTFEWS